MTATQALYLIGAFKPGKSILWHAGASTVSIAGIQLSKADHASAVYVTAGSDEKIKFCVEELGATAGVLLLYSLIVSFRIEMAVLFIENGEGASFGGKSTFHKLPSRRVQ